MHKLSTLFFLLFFFFHQAKPDLYSERGALLAFRSAVRGRTLLLWSPSSPFSPCYWFGVQCDLANSTVVSLRLPAAALSGYLPSGVFPSLPHLRTLSLRLNSLYGPIPTDLAACSSLRNLYLHQNNLSGYLPASLFTLTNLVRLNLAQNSLSGPVQTGFNNMTRLRSLYLQNNRFTGSLPELRLGELAQFNVSNNLLNGTVPEKLRAFSKDSFLGNALCGKPLNVCAGGDGGKGANGSVSPGLAGDIGTIGNNGVIENENEKKKGKFSGGVIAGIVVGSVVGLLIVVFAFILLCRNKSGGTGRTSSVEYIANWKPEVGMQGDKKHVSDLGNVAVGGGGNGNGSSAVVAAAAGDGGQKKLMFFGNAGKVFDLEDLLRASAEVLGKGTFGTTYKAALEDGPLVAVKRLKDVAVSESEFREKIEVVGGMVHENLAPLRAYYYSRDEKLLVHDYLPMGSLSALLHGNKGGGGTQLNWELRSAIALGVARGIEHLHLQGLNISHGNIKSSNILLTKTREARVSDFGLAQLVGPTASSTPNRVAGYRAPEVTDPRRVSQKADVYSFGVVLLELLTGKAPIHALLNEEGVDLPRWVQSVFTEEWSSEVFDPELGRYQNVEEEMVLLLQLALDCVVLFPDKRPSMFEVRHRIEELRNSSLDEDQDQIHQHDLINVVDD